MEKAHWRKHQYWLGSIVWLWWVASALAQGNIATVPDLLALTPGVTGTTALVSGRSTANDGGGGVFFYVAASTTTTNLGTVFKPNSAAGRWLREYSGDINPAWFGAVSGQDSTLALTNALAVAGNGTLRIPQGLFLLSSPLSVGSTHARITGAGKGATTLRWTGSAGLAVIIVGDGVTSLNGWGIDNLNIDGAGVTPGIKVDYAHEGFINQCIITNAASFGVHYTNGWVNTIQNCQFINLTASAVGVKLDGGSGHRIAFNTFTTGATGTGINFVQDSNGLTIGPGNVFEGNAVGIEIPKTANSIRALSIFGNYFENCTTMPFRVGATGSGNAVINLSIDANEIATANNGAITLTQATGVSVENNHFGVAITYASTVTNLWLKNNFNSGRVVSTTTCLDMDAVSQIGIQDLVMSRNAAYSLNIAGNLAIATNLTITSLSGVLKGNLTSPVTALTGTANQVALWTDGVTLGGNSALTFSAGALHLAGDLEFSGSRTLYTTTGNLYLITGAGNGNVVLTPQGSGVIQFDKTANFTAAGTGIGIKEGSNARMGATALVNGTVTVSNTSVTANTRVFLTRQVQAGTTSGTPSLGTVVAATSFVINSLTDAAAVSADDDSTIGWLLVEPSP